MRPTPHTVPMRVNQTQAGGGAYSKRGNAPTAMTRSAYDTILWEDRAGSPSQSDVRFVSMLHSLGLVGQELSRGYIAQIMISKTPINTAKDDRCTFIKSKTWIPWPGASLPMYA
jgi:hypothetical protein